MVTACCTLSPFEFQDEARNQSVVWDREWCRYFSEPNASTFFADMKSSDRKLWIETQELAKYTKHDFYFANIFGDYSPEVWISPNQIIGKIVFELGCGPSTFGKIAGKLCTRYYGIDYSHLALYVAKILSPTNCTFYHISQTDRIVVLEGEIDTVVSRHFFIHQNIVNVRWIFSKLYAHVLRDSGQAVLDFWPYAPDTKIEKVVIREAKGPLCAIEPSCVYFFDNPEIEQLATEAGFRVIDSVMVANVQRRFVTIERRPRK